MIEINEHVPLNEHGTFRVGGPARFFAIATTHQDVQEIKRFSVSDGLPLFVLGGGSNMLFGDAGFSGVVMKMAIGGIAAHGEIVVAGAGIDWDVLVAWTVAHGLFGLENLSGIPGTVGGAVVGNIGAYGKEMGDYLEWVTVVDGERVRRLSPRECHFGYRSSIFKTPAAKGWVVTEAAFKLSHKPAPALQYPDLIDYFERRGVGREEVTPPALRSAVLDIRAAKLPDLGQVGTAGSFFKNPVIDRSVFEALKKRFPEMPGFPERNMPERVKVPAGWLLDKVCGFKGKRWGAVAVHDRQALVLVAGKGAAATDVAAAAAEMVAAVAAATGITLEREVEYLF